MEQQNLSQNMNHNFAEYETFKYTLTEIKLTVENNTRLIGELYGKIDDFYRNFRAKKRVRKP